MSEDEVYDLKWLKERGFFSSVVPFQIKGKNVIVDKKNFIAYLELNKNENPEEFRKEIMSKEKIKYIWFYFPSDNKLKVFRKTKVDEIRWFYYSQKMRHEYKKSRIDKLKRFSPSNINALFDIRDIMDNFYWQLWKYRISMAKSIKDLNEDKNKLLVVQHFIDRLIFFYFLAQLKLVKIKTDEGGIWVLDRKNTRKFFEWVCSNLNEQDLQKFLNKLFFEVLGQVNETGFISKKFNVGKETFNISSPCLNGGLFVENEIEGKRESEIKISKIKDLILEVLNKYNWIIGEELPDEEDVIGDLTPDIIGHIYEKFVVSLEQIGLGKIKLHDIQNIKQELRYKRKKIGAYYTPEEITSYISTHTIYPYIQDKINEKFKVKYKNIYQELISKDKFNAEELKIIKYLYFEILSKIKICDNACGSGSFLIAAGDVLLKLYSKVLKILEKEMKDDKDVKMLIREKANSPSRNYYIVRQIIVNNLYGVDIMEGAVEIAKLRFWLWLISQVNPKDLEGKKIETLPNLDFNLMVGNSLIGFVDIESVDFDFVGRLRKITTWLGTSKIGWLKNLAKEKQKFKTLPSHEAIKLKENLNKELDQAREFLNEQFYQMLKAKGIKISKDEFLNLKPFHWGFEFYEVFDLEKPKEERGFDIIIGNPPYVRQENINNIFEGLNYKMLLSKIYEPFDNTFDLSMFFILKSLQITKEKGYHSFIITNKWLRAKYGEKIRKYLKENVTIKKVIDFNGIKVFVGATVDTLLYVIIKDKPKEEHSIFYNNPEDLNAIERNGYYVKQKDLTDDVWNFVNEEEKEIKAWIEKVGTPLKNLNLKIYRGVLTGFNDAFIIDDETRKKLIEEDQKSNEIIYPILVGKDVHRYYTKWPMSYLILSKNRMKVDKEYPAVFEHLKKYRKQLEERWDKGFYWFNLRECTYYEDFLKPKLIWREISHNNSRFYYDNSGFYTDATAYIAVLSDSNINLKFILTLLNSKFLYKIAKNFYFVSLTEDTIRFRKHEVEKLPVRLSTSYIERLPHLADYMLFLNAMEERRNKEKEIIDFIDKEVIDSLVYELYFKEKFYQDKLYAQPKEYLLDLISKYLKPINYDRWAEIYYKKMLEGEISKKEEEELKELEKKNSETIREVIEKIKNDKKIIEQIEKIKNHRRVKIIEGGKK